MSRKSAILSAFFDQLTTFVGELTQMYPDDADFQLFLVTIKMMKTANPSLVVKEVCNAVQGMEEKIAAKDETFFMNRSYDEYSEVEDKTIFDKLKQYVGEMSFETKEIVWKYVQNVVKLAKAYQSL
jgi:hypothetical protein